MAFDLTLDDSQHEVLATFRRFFDRECPPAVVRAAEPVGFSAELWSRLRALGAPGLGVEEQHGGGGASLSDLTIVLEAAGRALAPAPLVEHLVASRSWPDDEVVDGAAIATLAVMPAVEGRWRLVPAGAVAQVVIGLDGADLVAVRSEAPGASPRNHADAPLADRSTGGDRVVVGDRETFARCVVEWQLLQAAQLCGLASRALAMTTDYVQERQQFGRPVGAFQAVQHGLADCVPRVEGTRLLVAKAAWALDEQRSAVDLRHGEIDDGEVLATMAFVFAAETAAAVTKKAVQYHGSYGVSGEYDIQLYYRRARGWPLVLGDPARQLQGLANRIWPEEG